MPCCAPLPVVSAAAWVVVAGLLTPLGAGCRGAGEAAPSAGAGAVHDASPGLLGEATLHPGVRSVLVSDLTPPDTRPADLSLEADTALRSAFYADGLFTKAATDDGGACAAQVQLMYGLFFNGELQADATVGEARAVLEGELHCPNRGGDAAELEAETYRASFDDHQAFGGLEQPKGEPALRAMLPQLAERVAQALYGQLIARHADDEALLQALASDTRVGVLMEAAAEAGERKLLAALPHLIRLIGHGEAAVALRAGAALGLIGEADPDALGALAKMTEGSDPERHLVAIHALGDIGGKRAARYLEALAVGHPQDAVRDAARAAATRARAGGSAPQADEGVQPL